MYNVALTTAFFVARPTFLGFVYVLYYVGIDWNDVMNGWRLRSMLLLTWLQFALLR